MFEFGIPSELGEESTCHRITDFQRLLPRESFKYGLFYVVVSPIGECQVAIDVVFLYRRFSNLWSFDAKCRVSVTKLENWDMADDKRVVGQRTVTVNKNNCKDAVRFLVYRQELSDYVINNKLKLLVDVETFNVVGIPASRDVAFEKSEEHFSDVALIAHLPCGTPRLFHVAKAVLATHSPVFHKMFYGEGSDPELAELVLEGDCCPAALDTFLELIYSADVMFYNDLDKIDRILMLATRYDVLIVRQKCEQELKNLTTMPFNPYESLAYKLKLASKYNLSELQETILFSLKNMEDVVELCKHSKHLDDVSRAALFERCLSFIN